MEIHRVDKTAEPERVVKGARPPAKPECSGGPSDRVELSGEARALLGAEAQAPAGDASDTAAVRAERVAEARDRMALGFYDRPEVRQSVLANLVESILGSNPDAK
jgi:hypothetical protein